MTRDDASRAAAAVDPANAVSGFVVHPSSCTDTAKSVAPPASDAPAPPREIATKLLGASTPEHYAGDYPPYINLTMERNPSAVVLTVRAPTVHGAPPGATTSVRLPHDAWLALVALIPGASTIYRACHELDALL